MQATFFLDGFRHTQADYFANIAFNPDGFAAG
jgi:hypothetical protein